MDATQPAAPARRFPRPTAALAPAAVVAAAVAASYAPNLLDLGRTWASDPNYSHGFLVFPIALAILWQRRDLLKPSSLRPNPLGWPILVAILAVRAWLFGRNEMWLENASMIPAAAALVLAFGGWPLLRWAAPALGFLVFLLPLPPRINLILAAPLQTLATIGSITLLQATGLPVLAQGHVILIGGERLEVAQACNGLSMLISFVTLITAMTILLPRSRPNWERVVLLLSTIPIALIANVLRIAGTAMVYHWLGAERGEKIAHDTAGWLMMPIALALVFAELKLMSWLVVEDDEPTDRPMVIAPPSSYTGTRMPPKKPA